MEKIVTTREIDIHDLGTKERKREKKKKKKKDIQVHVGLNRDLLDHKTCYDQRNELGPLRLPLSKLFAARQPLRYEMVK